ncbi:MAG TPA: hypothetical protein PKA50_17010, partial [Gemmatimonadales bacterium]|nr:hypothetical protein [Gemmatimonadales bacterium]
AERAQAGGHLPATGAMAAALEQLGRHEEAVTLVTAAIARHDVWVVQFPNSARYDALRRDPTVAARLARLQR